MPRQNPHAMNAASLFHDALLNTLPESGNADIDVDLFAGGGGASAGITEALGRAPAVAVNHNRNALGAYARNNIRAKHYLTDVREVDPRTATGGRPVRLLWASPDCTSFSTAKGAAPIKRSLRALPWVVPAWAAAVRPRFIIMENVTAISTTWGPLVAKRDANGQVKRDPHGNIIRVPSANPRKRNRTWKRFVASIERLGYAVEFRTLCAADYGAPTTRKRLFMIASRDHETYQWPEPTHAPATDPRVISGELQPWVPVHNILNFDLHADSVITRKKPIVKNTQFRVAVGIHRHVLLSETPFVIQQGERTDTCALIVNNHNNAPQSLNNPSPTITTQHNRLKLITAHGAMYRGQNPGRDLRLPCPTITAGGNPKRPSTGNPIGVAFQDWKSARCVFLSMYFTADPKRDPGGHTHPVTRPAATITTVDHHGLASVNLTPLNAHALITYYGGKQGLERNTSLQEPMPTQTTSNRHALLTAALHNQSGVPLNHADPLATLSDEERHTAQALHDLVIHHVPQAAEFSYQGRALMREFSGRPYILTDASLRLLDPDELKLAQGFKPEYVLHENQHGDTYTRDVQVKLIGNSVPPPFSRALCRALKPLLDQPAQPRPLPAWLAQRRQKTVLQA